MPLSEDAKKELKEAIRIVREDKFEAFAREHLGGYKARDVPGEPPADPNDPPKDPNPTDPPKPRKSGYWGELGID